MASVVLGSIFLLAFLAILALYFLRRSTSANEADALPPRRFGGLFAEASAEEARKQADLVAAEETARLRETLRRRAQQGDKGALLDARQTSDAALYDEVLNSLAGSADDSSKLLALVSYVARHELPVNQRLAGAFIESCKLAPNRSSAAKMLHIAALSDGASVYRIAVEAALESWRSGCLPGVSAEELRAVLDGEFWILSSRARSSGAGFRLKRTLAEARRELTAAS